MSATDQHPINTRSQIVRYTITTRQKRLIRTPLNAIVGFSNLLADTSDIEEREQVHPIPRIRLGHRDLGKESRTNLRSFYKIKYLCERYRLGFVHLQEHRLKLGREIGVKSTLGCGSTFWFSLPYDPLYKAKSGATGH